MDPEFILNPLSDGSVEHTGTRTFKDAIGETTMSPG